MWVMKLFENFDLPKEIVFELLVDELREVNGLDRNGTPFFLAPIFVSISV